MIKSRRMRWAEHEWGEKRNTYRILVGKPEGGGHWEDQGVSGWTILKWISERWNGMDWIDLARDRDRWRTLVNTVMNLRFP
jgi:hypothetical protein